MPGNANATDGGLVLRVKLSIGNLDNMKSELRVSKENFPFPEVKIDFNTGVDAAKEEKIGEELKRYSEIIALRDRYRETLAKAWTKEGLFKGFSDVSLRFEEQRGNKTHIRVVEEKEWVPWSVAWEDNPNSRPLFVENSLRFIEEGILRETFLDFMKDDENQLRRFLKVAVKRNLSKHWMEFRSTVDELTQYAETRNPASEPDPPISPGPSLPRPPSEYDPDYREKNRALEDQKDYWENYPVAFRDWRHKKNADQFFENWRTVFADDILSELWPYIIVTSQPDCEQKLDEAHLNLSNLKNQFDAGKIYASQLENAPPETLGDWFLDLEFAVVDEKNPILGTNEMPSIIRLIWMIGTPKNP